MYKMEFLGLKINYVMGILFVQIGGCTFASFDEGDTFIPVVSAVFTEV